MDTVQRGTCARAAEYTKADQPDAEPRACAVAEEIEAGGVLSGQRALPQQPCHGRCADRIASRQPKDYRARCCGRQTVQQGERTRQQPAEQFHKAGPHQQSACHKKRKQRGQGLARGKGKPVAHAVRTGGGAEQKRGKQRER